MKNLVLQKMKKSLLWSLLFTTAMLFLGVLHASAQPWGYSTAPGGNGSVAQWFNFPGHNTFFPDGQNQETPTSRAQLIRLLTANETPGIGYQDGNKSNILNGNSDRFLTFTSLTNGSIIRAMALTAGTSTNPNYTYTIVLPGGTVTADGVAMTRTTVGTAGSNTYNFTFKAEIDVPVSGYVNILGASTSTITLGTGKSATFPTGPANGAALQLNLSVDVSAYTGRITVEYNLSTNEVSIIPAPSVDAYPNPVNFSAINLQQGFTLTGQFLQAGNLTLTTNNAAYTFQSTGTQTMTVPVNASGGIDTGNQTITVNATTSAPASGGTITITGGGLPPTGYVVDLNYLPPTVFASPDPLVFSSTTPSPTLNVTGVGLNADLVFTPSTSAFTVLSTARNGVDQPVTVSSDFTVATGTLKISGGGLAPSAEITINLSHAAAAVSAIAPIALSAVKTSETFTLTASNVVGSLSLAASAGFTVSLGSVSSSSTGTISQSITVSSPAGANSTGTLTISGGGLASNVTVPLTYSPPTVTVDPEELVYADDALSKSFTLDAVGLNGNLTLTASSGYTFASSGTNSMTVTVTLGAANQTIVVLRAPATASDGSVIISGGGLSPNITVPLTIPPAGPVSTYCKETLVSTNYVTSVMFTNTLLEPGKYQLTIEADEDIDHTNGSHISINGAGSFQVIAGTSGITISKPNSKTMVIVVTSTSPPLSTSPFYVYFVGNKQANFDFLFSNISVWGTCPVEKPTVTKADPSTSPTSNSATFTVSANSKSANITHFIILDGGIPIYTHTVTPSNSNTVSNLPITITLDPNTTYNNIEVVAKNADNGESVPYPVTPFTTGSIPLPDLADPEMKSVSVPSGTITKTTAEFSVNATDNEGVVKFEVYQGATKVAEKTIAPNPSATTTIEVTGLTRGATYNAGDFTVVAYDAAGNYSKPPFPVPQFTMKDNTECAGESTEKSGSSSYSFTLGYEFAFSTSGTTVTATFKLLDDFPGLGQGAFFQLGGTQVTPFINSTTKVWTSTFPGQTVGSTIELGIMFMATGDNIYTKNFSYTVGNNCIPDTTDPVVTHAAVDDEGTITETGAILDVTATDDVGVTLFVVYNDGTYLAEKAVSSQSPATTTINLTGLLDPGTLYDNMTVEAYDAAGNYSKPPFSVTPFTTLTGDEVPPVMESATFVNKTSSAATIEVFASDDVTDPVVRFLVSINGAPRQSVSEAEWAIDDKITLTGLTGGNYYVEIWAMDGAKNVSENSKIVIFKIDKEGGSGPGGKCEDTLEDLSSSGISIHYEISYSEGAFTISAESSETLDMLALVINTVNQQLMGFDNGVYSYTDSTFPNGADLDLLFMIFGGPLGFGTTDQFGYKVGDCGESEPAEPLYYSPNAPESNLDDVVWNFSEDGETNWESAQGVPDHNKIVVVRSNQKFSINRQAAFQTVDVQAGGELIVESGNRLIIVDDLMLHKTEHDASSIESDGTMIIEGDVKVTVAFENPLLWNFVSFPFDAVPEGIVAPRVRTYSISNRAQHLSGWSGSSDGDFIEGGKAYIMWAEEPIVFKASGTPDFSTGTRKNTGLEFEPASGNGLESDEGWNFIVHPMFSKSAQTIIEAGQFVYKYVYGEDDYTVDDESVISGENSMLSSYFVKIDETAVTDLTHNFIGGAKSAGTMSNENIVLKLKGANGYNYRTKIRVVPGILAGYNSYYDAPHMVASLASTPQIYSLLGADKMAIKAVSEQSVVPVGVRVPAAGEYTLAWNSYITEQKAILRDGDTEIDMNDQSEYTFSTDKAGEINNRFTVCFVEKRSDPTLAPQYAGETLKIYTTAEGIVVEGLSAGDMVKLYDVTGRLLQAEQATTASVQLNAPAKGVYLLNINDKTRKVIK